MGNNIKDHLVLDYDLWQTMMHILDLITIPLKGGKVDSHIKGKAFKEGIEPKGNKYSRLNTVVDEWVGSARTAHKGQYPQQLYPDGVVMVKKGDGCFIYGNIANVVTWDINQNLMIKCLMEKN